MPEKRQKKGKPLLRHLYARAKASSLSIEINRNKGNAYFVIYMYGYAVETNFYLNRISYSALVSCSAQHQRKCCFLIAVVKSISKIQRQASPTCIAHRHLSFDS